MAKRHNRLNVKYNRCGFIVDGRGILFWTRFDSSMTNEVAKLVIFHLSSVKCKMKTLTYPRFCVNDLSQISHWKGRSPEWVLMWLTRFLFCEKHLPHSSHWKGFSPVWVRSWWRRFVFCLNVLSQSWNCMVVAYCKGKVLDSFILSRHFFLIQCSTTNRMLWFSSF